MSELVLQTPSTTEEGQVAGSPPSADTLPSGGPPSPPPARLRRICFNCVGSPEEPLMRWPGCAAYPGTSDHAFHGSCVVALPAVQRGLAHMHNQGGVEAPLELDGGSLSRLASAPCPLCRRGWGVDREAS